MEFFNNHGRPPRNQIDWNVRTDVSWLSRLTGGGKAALEDIRDLVENDGRMSVSQEFLDQHEAEKVSAQAAVPKISRNEPCPCGSGKKYKFCCGRAK